MNHLKQNPPLCRHTTIGFNLYIFQNGIMQKSKGSGMVNFVPSLAIEREGLELYHVRVLKCNWLDNNNNNNKTKFEKHFLWLSLFILPYLSSNKSNNNSNSNSPESRVVPPNSSDTSATGKASNVTRNNSERKVKPARAASLRSSPKKELSPAESR